MELRNWKTQKLNENLRLFALLLYDFRQKRRPCVIFFVGLVFDAVNNKYVVVVIALMRCLV